MDIYTVLLLSGMAVMSLAKYRENYVCTNFRSACVTWALQGWCDVPTYWTRLYCCHSCHKEATGCPNGQTRNHEGECQDINFCGTYPQHKRCPGEQICKTKKGGFICGNCASGHMWDKGSQKCVENKKNNPGLTSTTVPPKETTIATKTTMTTTSTTTSTTLPPKETTKITTTATSTTIATTALASQPIDGICPDTDRSLETWSDGETRLMDRKSAEGSFRPWTVIQRRTDGSVNFDKNWSEYETGFGSKSSSFWLGLREIHYLCNEDNKCQLLVNLKWSGKPDNVFRVADGCYYASYSEFWLSGPADDYVLTISGYKGTAGNSLSWNTPLINISGSAFSTMDRNNQNCAASYGAGWWFNSRCAYGILNARWGDTTGFRWYHLTGQNGPLEFSEMKVRSKI